MKNREHADPNDRSSSIGEYMESNADRLLEAIAKEELNVSNRIKQGKTEWLDKKNGNEWFEELLGSIALEEAAIAHLIHAEAGKIEAFFGREGEFPTSPTNQQINDFQNAVARVLEAVVEKQRLLIRMVELSKRFSDRTNEESDH